MATPPFEPDETKPASSDLISAFPAAEQTFRDIIEDWLLTISTSSGVLKEAAFPTNLSIGGSFNSGESAGAISDVSGFGQPLGTNSSGNTGLTIETTDTSGIAAILFNVGTTAYGQIRYLHASEDMTFYTDNTIRMTLDAAGITMASNHNVILNSGGELQLASGSSGDPSLTFVSDTNTGFWNDTNVGTTYTLNGTDRVQFDANGITILVNGDSFLAPDGSESSPSFTFSGDTNVGVYRPTTNVIGFTTAGECRLRITSGGTARFGPESFDGAEDAGVAISGTTDGAGAVSATRSGNASLYLNRLASNGNIVEFSRQNDFIAAISITTGAVTYNTTSDARRKENARSFDSGAIIDALPMEEFDWVNGAGVGYGVLVDEDKAAVLPTAFSYDESNDLWMADYSKLVPVLWHEVAQLRARVKELEG